MDVKEILNFCIGKGVLLDKEVLKLFQETKDFDSVKLILEKIIDHTNKKLITKDIFQENKEKVTKFFLDLPSDKQEGLKELKIKLGLRIEISGKKTNPSNYPDKKIIQTKDFDSNKSLNEIKVFPHDTTPKEKIEVKHFVKHYVNRFCKIRDVLKGSPELNNLLSINKISGNRQTNSIIGIVYDKKITKNKNILLEVEDLTGRIKVLITKNRPETYEKAEDIALDSVLGFRGSGNRDIFFVNEVVFPDVINPERKKSSVEEHALFIGCIHVGSKLFLEDNFLKFIDYLNGKIPNTPDFDKIKYLFVVGDLVAGIGVYPNQERELEIKDIEGQYLRIAELFGKIRKDIKLIILPGNHDCVRIMEPQPILDERYAWPLYNLKNAVFTTNPSWVNIGAKKDFSGFNVLSYHGYSFSYYASTIPSLISQDAINSPTKIMKYLLKNRHLAPTHSSTQHSPSEKDGLLIDEIPDIFVSSHIHKSAVAYHNNILTISTSCWEHLTSFQEKMGNKPDFCKVPLFNLKTRQIKILDFYDGEEK